MTSVASGKKTLSFTTKPIAKRRKAIGAAISRVTKPTPSRRRRGFVGSTLLIILIQCSRSDRLHRGFPRCSDISCVPHRSHRPSPFAEPTDRRRSSRANEQTTSRSPSSQEAPLGAIQKMSSSEVS